MTLGMVMAALAASGALVAAPAGAAAGCVAGFSDQGGGVCSLDLVPTRSVVSVTVPTGVTAMTFDVRGAAGGTSTTFWNGNGSPGGKGGREVATVPVTPGDTLQLVVGEAGTNDSASGSWGGGGTAASSSGGGGGGGSFVFDSAGSPLVVAGGGGGGGFDYNVDNSYATYYATQRAPGGDGAGAGTATDGQSVSFKLDTTYNPPQHFAPGGGHGATSSGPGAGGHSLITPNFIFGQADGASGAGPASGPVPVTSDPLTLDAALGAGGEVHGWAGGGGGGYFGGGAGGTIQADLEGGGGGGGAGFVSAGATSAASSTGVTSGDGSIRASYTVPSGGGGGGQAGAITSFSPTSGGPGTVVTISATGLGTPTKVRFNGLAAQAVTSSGGTITATVPPGATTGRISVSTVAGTVTSTGSFTVLAPPTITGFSPTTASAGMSVTVTGANLASATSVKVGGLWVSPSSTSTGSLVVTVPAGAATKQGISVQGPGGVASTTLKLAIVPVPLLSSASPTTASVGTKVTLLGSGLKKATSVTVGGVAATFKLSGSTKVVVTIPAGATTGAVAVTTAGGTAVGPILTIV